MSSVHEAKCTAAMRDDHRHQGVRRGGRDLEALCIVDAQQAHLPARQKQADARVGCLERRHAVDGRRAPAHGVRTWRSLSTLSASAEHADATVPSLQPPVHAQLEPYYWPALLKQPPCGYAHKRAHRFGNARSEAGTR